MIAPDFKAKARELCVSMPNQVKVRPCNGCGYCDQIAEALRQAAADAERDTEERITECMRAELHDAGMDPIKTRTFENIFNNAMGSARGGK